MERWPGEKASPDRTEQRQIDVAITWLGHATVLIELDGARILTDPVLRGRVGPLRRIAPLTEPEQLAPVDCVLLSHLHADHTDLPTLRRIPRAGPLLVPYGARDWLLGKGLRDVRELRQGQSMNVCSLRVTATHAEHDPRRRPAGPEATALGHIISGTSSVYFAGDTDLFREMSDLRGSVDVALLPIWGWGSRLGPGHLDPERAAAAVALISPVVAVPIHFGTLKLGWRRPPAADALRPAREFEEFAHRYAPAVETRVLGVGERVEFHRPEVPRQ